MKRPDAESHLWFSGGVIWKKEGNDLYFLLQGNTSTNPRYGFDTQVKFPGGGNNEHPEDITPIHTLRREIMEETNLRIKDDADLPVLCEIPKLWGYKQFFYLIHESAIESMEDLRKEVKYDEDSRLDPPTWVHVSEAKLAVYKTHQPPLAQAIREIDLMGW